MYKTSLNSDPSGANTGADQKGKKQKKGLFSTIGPVKATVIGTIILHLLGFKFATQLIDGVVKGARTAKDVAGMLWKRTWGIFAALLLSVAGAAWGMYTWHGFWVAVFAFTTLLFLMYVVFLVVSVFLLFSMKADKTIRKQGIQAIGELFQHVLYWDVMLMLVFLLYEPWNRDPRLFTIFGLSQIALFIINETWRHRVRAASVLICATVGICLFANLTYAHLPAAVQKIIDGGVRVVELAGTKATSFSSLPAVDQLLDVDQNDKVDSVDADIIERDLAFRFDNNRLLQKIGDGWYPKGDFDGNGAVNSIDAVLLRGFLAKPPKNAAPAPLETRVPIATQYGVRQPAPAEELADVPIVPQQHPNIQQVIPKLEQQLPPAQDQGSRLVQYASVVTNNKPASQPVDDAIQPSVQVGIDSAYDTHASLSDNYTMFDTVFADILWLDSTEGFRVGVSEIHAGEAGTDVKFVWVAPLGTKNARQRAIACVNKFTYLRSTDPDTCYVIREYLTGLKPTQSVSLEPGKPFEAVIRFDRLPPGIRWLMVCLKDFKQKFYPSPYFAVT